jgi:hypothetical protein
MAPPVPRKGRERASYPQSACQREDPNHGGLIADEGANPMTSSRPILALPPRPTLRAQRLKVTLVLGADELATIPVEDGRPRVTVAHPLARSQTHRQHRGHVVARGQAAICVSGSDAIALVLQGCLVDGDIIAEAGLSAQPKAVKGGRKPMFPRQPTVTMGHVFGRATSECKALAVARPERGLSFPSRPKEGEDDDRSQGVAAKDYGGDRRGAMDGARR